MSSAKKRLIEAEPLMKCGPAVEFYQRLQWLSEGMLANHLNSVIHFKINQAEIDLYHKYKAEQLEEKK